MGLASVLVQTIASHPPKYPSQGFFCLSIFSFTKEFQWKFSAFWSFNPFNQHPNSKTTPQMTQCFSMPEKVIPLYSDRRNCVTKKKCPNKKPRCLERKKMPRHLPPDLCLGWTAGGGTNVKGLWQHFQWSVNDLTDGSDFSSFVCFAGKVQESWRECWRLLSNLPGYWRPDKVRIVQNLWLESWWLATHGSTWFLNGTSSWVWTCNVAKERHGHLTFTFRYCVLNSHLHYDV